MATKLYNKARALEDEVNDGRKHFGQLPTKNSSNIYNSCLSSRLCSIVLLCCYGVAMEELPWSSGLSFGTICASAGLLFHL